MAAWDALLAGPLRGGPLVRLLATHGHTDHVGAAGPLVRRHAIPFLGTLTEWQTAKLRHVEVPGPPDPAFAEFVEMHGCDEAIQASFDADRKRISRYLAPLPAQLVRIRDGERLELGIRMFEVMVAGGHADEHASLWCEAENILLAGDQILERISPVLAVTHQMPGADPLGEYLSSLDRFRHLPPNTLVLPSHGRPFTGLHRRIAELRRHHEERLRAAWDLLDAPKTGAEVSVGLFEKAVRGGQGRLALGETLAHLHRLVRLDLVGQRTDGGRITFVRSGDADRMLGRLTEPDLP